MKKISLFFMYVLWAVSSDLYAANGELWETKSSMSSKAYGRMNLGTVRECRPLQWRQKPVFSPENERNECQFNQVSKRNNRYTFQFKCQDSAGKGYTDIVNGDRMIAYLQVDAEDDSFNINIDTHKVGNCSLK